jgi:hypothetical protein
MACPQDAGRAFVTVLPPKAAVPARLVRRNTLRPMTACPPETLARLQAEVTAWAKEPRDSEYGTINQQPSVTIVAVTDGTVRAELEFQLWSHAQSGSSWGHYFLRIVEVTGGERRVLGEIEHRVTEWEDEFGTPTDALDALRARVYGR